MKPIERLELFLKSEGITITACEEKCGFSLGTLRKAISKKTDLKTDSIIKIIEAYPNLDTDWFLMGKGIMIKSVNPSNILENFIEQFISQKYGETIKGFEQKIKALEDAKLIYSVECQASVESCQVHFLSLSVDFKTIPPSST